MFKAIFLLGFLVFLHAPSTEGACCSPNYNKCVDTFKCYCADGTIGTPYCGYEACNFFGCACKGGCRKASGRSLEVEREAPGLDEFKAFKAIDTNGDGLIDKKEAKAGVKLVSFDVETLQKIDLDKDGLISPQEFDDDISEEVMRMI